jgi:chromosome segregation ATPase
MNEETTRELPDRSSFEQRVFARFDSIDTRLEKLESRNYDTKPIWEKALAAIMETRLEVGELRNKVDVIETKVDVIETKVDVIETKVDVIETKVDAIETKVDVIETKVDAIETKVGNLQGDVAALRNDYGNLHNELVESQRDFKVKLTRRIDLVLEVMIDNRDSWRNADARLTQLESKLA